jgi:hypothetical protein
MILLAEGMGTIFSGTFDMTLLPHSGSGLHGDLKLSLQQVSVIVYPRCWYSVMRQVIGAIAAESHYSSLNNTNSAEQVLLL